MKFFFDDLDYIAIYIVGVAINNELLMFNTMAAACELLGRLCSGSTRVLPRYRLPPSSYIHQQWPTVATPALRESVRPHCTSTSAKSVYVYEDISVKLIRNYGLSENKINLKEFLKVFVYYLNGRIENGLQYKCKEF